MNVADAIRRHLEDSGLRMATLLVSLVFPRAVRSQLRNGADKGNPTVL